ncbi:MAG TPA: hypothetical protein DDW76_11700 [Cyanobacteria bacterium UBA11369]|nr:hypothetical protein [Cyanobacteria bacterium UBA11371]HBE36247.1 hypothetical protein [Cyanobacteria bacterium UBA11368]HBE49435.1 hypothetical protein [Cyanobacteria bacterium UBA11369]
MATGVILYMIVPFCTTASGLSVILIPDFCREAFNSCLLNQECIHQSVAGANQKKYRRVPRFVYPIFYPDLLLYGDDIAKLRVAIAPA